MYISVLTVRPYQFDFMFLGHKRAIYRPTLLYLTTEPQFIQLPRAGPQLALEVTI